MDNIIKTFFQAFFMPEVPKNKEEIKKINEAEKAGEEAAKKVQKRLKVPQATVDTAAAQEAAKKRTEQEENNEDHEIQGNLK